MFRVRKGMLNAGLREQQQLRFDRDLELGKQRSEEIPGGPSNARVAAPADKSRCSVVTESAGGVPR